MTTVYVTSSNKSLLPLRVNDSTYALHNLQHSCLSVNKRPRRSFSQKIGYAAGRTVKFFKKTETKMTALISYWAVETLLFALIIFSLTAFTPIAAALLMYLYGTYAIFAAVNALAK